MNHHLLLTIVFATISLNACSQSAPPTYPNSDISYAALDSQIGCDSKYSDDKKEDIFNTNYKNHWMTWSGEILLVEADNASINIDGKGTQDLQVKFADEKAGYDLQKGSHTTIRFLMESAGGCFFPFFGTEATIVSSKDEVFTAPEESVEEQAQRAAEEAAKDIPSSADPVTGGNGSCEPKPSGGPALGDDFEGGVFLCREPAEGQYWTDWYALETPGSDSTILIKSTGKESEFTGTLSIQCTTGSLLWSDTHNFDESIDPKQETDAIVPAALPEIAKQILCKSGQADA